MAADVGASGVVVSGKFVGPADLGGGLLDSIGNAPTRNYVVAKFTKDGAHLWSHSHFVNHFSLDDETTGSPEPGREPIAILDDGSVVVAVPSASEVRFGLEEFTGGQGMVLARFSP